MNLEIKLADPKYCNGCPCIKGRRLEIRTCDCIKKELKCEYAPMEIKYIRPAICIKTNGE